MGKKPESDAGGVERAFERAVKRETAVHGERWAAQYGGYFSDPAVAAPFLEIIEEYARAKQPDVLVDLGGGTGFILTELIKRAKIPADLSLFDLDLSDRQLESLPNSRIRSLKNSILEFRRASVANEKRRLMLITRSTLHYAGIMGQAPTLRHIREQMKPGEIFINQTGCSSTPEEALLTDELLERMRSDKWMAPLGSLVELCEKAGFRVKRKAKAPDLWLDEPTLSDRYGINADEMTRIREKLMEGYKDSPHLRMTPKGFVIIQEYRILACEAV